MAFNTIRPAGYVNCEPNSGSAYRTSRYENNIIYNTAVASAVTGTDCKLSYNVIFPYTAAAGTNIVADPQFIDLMSSNYRLKSTNPAIDAAVPSAYSIGKPDFDGVARPQGGSYDIGAFEFTP